MSIVLLLVVEALNIRPHWFRYNRDSVKAIVWRVKNCIGRYITFFILCQQTYFYLCSLHCTNILGTY